MAAESKTQFTVEEIARSLTSQSKFYEAVSRLEDLESSDLGLELLRAECYMQLGRESKGLKAIRNLKKILKTSEVTPSHVQDLADEYYDTSTVVRELVLYKIASELYQESDELSNDDKMNAVYKCLIASENVMTRMIKSSEKSEHDPLGLLSNLKQALSQSLTSALTGSGTEGLDLDALTKSDSSGSERLQVLALDFGMEYLNEMFEYLWEFEGVDQKKKALKIAHCANAMGYSYGIAKQWAKSVKMREKGIKIMKGTFGENAKMYKIFGSLYRNSAACLFNDDRFREAEPYYEFAIEYYESATDYSDDESKQKDVSVSKSSLKSTRNRLGM